MEPIGGYFELELKNVGEYHNPDFRLNTARNAIELVLRLRKYKKVLLPRYICNSVLESIKKLQLNYAFYSLNRNLLPSFSNHDDDTCMIIVNYFGLLERGIVDFAKASGSAIIDNSQAFFSHPVAGVDSVYSPRKFFGVPDGGYLYTSLSCRSDFEQDTSYQRSGHLLKRVDLSPEEGFQDFRQAQKALSFQPIRRMSKLTQALLSSIDYEFVRKRRNENFSFLHENLREKNELTELIESNNIDGPMVYPFMTKDPSLREKLHKNRIYVATYWNDVFERTDENSLEWQLAKYMIPLPIDQRYGNSDMIQVLNRIY